MEQAVFDRIRTRPLLTTFVLLVAGAGAHLGIFEAYFYARDAGIGAPVPNILSILLLMSAAVFFPIVIAFAVVWTQGILRRLIVALGGKPTGEFPNAISYIVGVVLFLLILISLPIYLFVVFAFTWSCHPTTTAEQAIARSKQYILDHDIGIITGYGGDASMVEHSERGNFAGSCHEPPRYHYARPSKIGGFDVRWIGFVKGDCPECWRRISGLINVTKCGHIWAEAEYGAWSLVRERAGNRSYCPPAYWPPGSKPDRDAKR